MTRDRLLPVSAQRESTGMASGLHSKMSMLDVLTDRVYILDTVENE
jgi:hypothetical protein